MCLVFIQIACRKIVPWETGRNNKSYIATREFTGAHIYIFHFSRGFFYKSIVVREVSDASFLIDKFLKKRCSTCL